MGLLLIWWLFAAANYQQYIYLNKISNLRKVMNLSQVPLWDRHSHWISCHHCMLGVFQAEEYFVKISNLEICQSLALTKLSLNEEYFVFKQESPVMFSVMPVCLFIGESHVTIYPWCHWLVTGQMGSPGHFQTCSLCTQTSGSWHLSQNALLLVNLNHKEIFCLIFIS